MDFLDIEYECKKICDMNKQITGVSKNLSITILKDVILISILKLRTRVSFPTSSLTMLCID